MVLITTCPSMVCRDHQYSWWFQRNKTEFIQYWSQLHKVAGWTPSLFRSPQLDPTRLQVLAYHSLWKMFFIKENTANGWIQIFSETSETCAFEWRTGPTWKAVKYRAPPGSPLPRPGHVSMSRWCFHALFKLCFHLTKSITTLSDYSTLIFVLIIF